MNPLIEEMKTLLVRELQESYECAVENAEEAGENPSFYFSAIQAMYDMDHNEIVFQFCIEDVTVSEIDVLEDYWAGDEYTTNFQSSWSEPMEEFMFEDSDAHERAVERILFLAIDLIDSMSNSGELKKFGFRDNVIVYPCTLDDAEDRDKAINLVTTRRVQRQLDPILPTNFKELIS